MDEIEALRLYGARLNAAAPPTVDVANRVLASIRRSPGERDWSVGAVRPLLAAAAASLLVAASLSVVAQQAVAEMYDPLTSLFTPFVVTLQ